MQIDDITLCESEFLDHPLLYNRPASHVILNGPNSATNSNKAISVSSAHSSSFLKTSASPSARESQEVIAIVLHPPDDDEEEEFGETVGSQSKKGRKRRSEPELEIIKVLTQAEPSGGGSGGGVQREQELQTNVNKVS